MRCTVFLKRSGLAVLAACCALSLLFSPPGKAATRPDKAELKAVLQEVLEENPDLILDILKKNSETVLEIAQQGNLQRTRKVMLAQWEQDAKIAKTPDLADRAFYGKADAPVTIVAYSDFTCPYCKRAESTLTPLLEKYKDKVRFTFKPLPREDFPLSVAAARYSTAAFMQDSAKGWTFYEEVFAGIEQAERDGDVYLKALAVKSHLDLKKLAADAASAKVENRINADRKEAEGFGITGTPCFLVNNLIVRGAVSKELFEEAIQMALKLKQSK